MQLMRNFNIAALFFLYTVRVREVAQQLPALASDSAAPPSSRSADDSTDSTARSAVASTQLALKAAQGITAVQRVRTSLPGALALDCNTVRNIVRDEWRSLTN